MFPRSLLLALALGLLSAPAHASSRPVWFVEVPVWDISDDGLPYRVGAILPGSHDPVSRLVRSREPRWVVAAGYATLPDLYDDGTGTLSGWGGETIFAGFAREWAWEIPGLDRRGAAVALVLDLGLNYAAASIPSNGTNFNFLVSPGFSWERNAGGGAVWHAGLRWFHLSNANIHDRNAGYDGLTFRFGRSW